MTRNINQIVDFIQYIARKERGVFITPDQAAANLDTAQLDCFEFWFRLYGTSQTVHDAIMPFRVAYSFTSTSGGIVTFPDNYTHLVGSPYVIAGSTFNAIRFYNEDEFPRAYSSQLRPISTTNPIAKNTSTGFSLYPLSTYIGTFSYLRRPQAPVYATIVGGTDGRTLLYDAANSVQLEWNDVYINKIIAQSLKYVGINMSEGEIYAFAQQYEKET